MDTGDHLAKDSDELFNDITDSEDEEDSSEEQKKQSRLTQPTFSSLNKVKFHHKKWPLNLTIFPFQSYQKFSNMTFYQKIHQNSPKRIIHRASYGAEQRTTSFNGTSKIPQQKRWR